MSCDECLMVMLKCKAQESFNHTNLEDNNNISQKVSLYDVVDGLSTFRNFRYISCSICTSSSGLKVGVDVTQLLLSRLSRYGAPWNNILEVNGARNLLHRYLFLAPALGTPLSFTWLLFCLLNYLYVVDVSLIRSDAHFPNFALMNPHLYQFFVFFVLS